MQLLLIDNYDSFTYNLYDYFCQLGAECRVLRNDSPELAASAIKAYDGVVFSPGPGRPGQAGSMMELLNKWYLQKPVLGICLGHQAIGEFFGAKLIRAKEPVHGKTSRVKVQNHPLFEGLPEGFQVMRYHSLLLTGLEGTPLKALAHTEEGEIMAIAHDRLPIWGIQYHPESILTEYGLETLNNWLGLCKIGAFENDKWNKYNALGTFSV